MVENFELFWPELSNKPWFEKLQLWLAERKCYVWKFSGCKPYYIYGIKQTPWKQIVWKYNVYFQDDIYSHP